MKWEVRVKAVFFAADFNYVNKGWKRTLHPYIEKVLIKDKEKQKNFFWQEKDRFTTKNTLWSLTHSSLLNFNAIHTASDRLH